MHREKAEQILRSAITAVQPAQLLQQYLAATNEALTICGQVIPKQTFKNLYVIGAGKAAAAMAVAVEEILGSQITDGLVTTKYHHALPTRFIRIIEAAHPVPDEKSVQAVVQTLQLLERVTPKDIVICLISGGASALWCDLPPAAILSEVQTTFDQLIKSGAAIQEINTVRKHLSGIKGGQLVRHCNGTRVFSLIISDVPGDDLNMIASGPTVPDPSTFQDAHTILSKYQLLPLLPASIVQHIEKGREAAIPETPKPGDALFNNTNNTIIANNRMAVEAAAHTAKKLGYHVHIIPHLITGEVETAAHELLQTAIQYKAQKPVCIIQGGETTVKVTGHGKGGRNQHFVLTALYELAKEQDQSLIDNITILSGGTDGTDGPTDATGAVGDKETLSQAQRQQLEIADYVSEHDAYHFFQLTNSLIITGPTQTNVMDLMMAIVQ